MSEPRPEYSTKLARDVYAIDDGLYTVGKRLDDLIAMIERPLRDLETDLTTIHGVGWDMLDSARAMKLLVADLQTRSNRASEIVGPHNKKRPPVEELEP